MPEDSVSPVSGRSSDDLWGEILVLRPKLMAADAKIVRLEALREEDARRHETAWKTMRLQRDVAQDEVERLREALTEAHRQLDRYEYKGPKQVGRAMLTIERALIERRGRCV